MHQQEFRVQERRQLSDLREKAFVGAAVFQSDKDFPKHSR
jgi:hypothetical protein